MFKEIRGKTLARDQVMDVCERSAPIGCGSAVTSRCHAPPLHACALGVQRNLRGRRSVEELQPSFDLPRAGTPRGTPHRGSHALGAVFYPDVGGSGSERSVLRAVTSGPGSGRRCLDVDPVGSGLVSDREQSSRKRHLLPVCPRARLSSCVFIQRASSLRGQVFRDVTAGFTVCERSRCSGW